MDTMEMRFQLMTSLLAQGQTVRWAVEVAAEVMAFVETGAVRTLPVDPDVSDA